MQFIYHENAGVEQLSVDVRAYEHLFKVRRMGEGARSLWRNLKDENLYEYQLKSVGKKEAVLERLDVKVLSITSLKSLHIGWCVIDPKLIEKALPMLSELGVERLSFIYSEFSQKSHKLDYERMERILINSCQQCGRSTRMVIETFSSLLDYFKAYPNSAVLDFCDNALSEKCAVDTLVVGPEGGFSEKERKLFTDKTIFGLTCKSILRSETAVVSVASKILA